MALLLSTTNTMAGLKDVYLLRIKGNEFIKSDKPDSAYTCFSRIVSADTVYANATDYMKLSYCSLLLNDTVNFKQYLTHSIKSGGADSAIIPLYFRPLDSAKQTYLSICLKDTYTPARASFLTKVDPLIESTMNDILYLDQICRRPEDAQYLKQHKSNTANPNFIHTKAIGRYIDSVNYDRVITLINSGRFPGFHNFGITSANYDPILMHISDHSEQQWNFIFNFLKQQVAAGNMTQNQLIAITTRHYMRDNCSYYGTIKMGMTKPCDCDNVDKYRSEIDIDSLKQEYQRLKQKLPDCYKE